MLLTLVDAETATQVEQAILAAWRETHGTETGRATSLWGVDAVVVLIEQAFAPGELALGRQVGQRALLERYERSLIGHMLEHQADRLAQTLGRAVASTGLSLNLDEGWLVCLFRLAPPA